MSDWCGGVACLLLVMAPVMPPMCASECCGARLAPPPFAGQTFCEVCVCVERTGENVCVSAWKVGESTQAVPNAGRSRHTSAWRSNVVLLLVWTSVRHGCGQKPLKAKASTKLSTSCWA